MTVEVKGWVWLYSNKQLQQLSILSWLISLLAGGAILFVLFLSCSWWFTLPPHVQPDLLTDTAGGHLQAASSGLCDLSRGEWVPDTSPPLYTHNTCRYLKDSRQNCVQNGRPDRDYLHWKWKPSDCELPPFNAARFLELMRGKKLAFIGDSLARNHMLSLQCALTQVEDSINLYSDPNDKEYKWLFPSYDFTIMLLWSPFLVNYTVEDDIYKLYLDEPEKGGSTQLAEYDIAIVSMGYWYYRKSLYYVNDTIVGAGIGSGHSETMNLLLAMRIALGNVLKHMTMEFEGITMLRTVTVDHFENGGWDTGGSCKRTRPFSNENGGIPPISFMNNRINKIQREEFEKAMAYVNDTSKLKILDVTYSAHLRPDGHAGPYRVRRPNDPVNDCLHWCVPGPIDVWNQFVWHALQPTLDR